MTPYYTSADGGIILYHGDCRELLPELDRVDVVITDPPYGIGLKAKTSDYRGSPAYDRGASLRATVLYDDSEAQIRALIAEVVPPLLRMTNRALIFPGPKLLWAYPEPRAIGCVFTMAGAGRSPWGFQCMHPVLFYGKDPYLVDRLGGRPNSLRDDQPNRERFDHPCPKPITWMRWAVTRASRKGECILDPFAGVGSTLVAAALEGRRGIGIELEEKYCAIAARRLEALPVQAVA